MNKIYLLSGGVGAVLAASAVVAFSAGDDSEKPSTAQAPAAVAAQFAAFDQTQSESDKVPGSTMPSATEDLRPGENPELSRALTDRSGRAVGYFWPEDSGVCLSIEGGSTCGSLQQIEEFGALTIASGSSDSTVWRVVGLTPDGNTDVRLTGLKGATVESTQTLSNGFSAVVRNTSGKGLAPKLQVRWVDASGQKHDASTP